MKLYLFSGSKSIFLHFCEDINIFVSTGSAIFSKHSIPWQVQSRTPVSGTLAFCSSSAPLGLGTPTISTAFAVKRLPLLFVNDSTMSCPRFFAHIIETLFMQVLPFQHIPCSRPVIIERPSSTDLRHERQIFSIKRFCMVFA